MLLKTCQTLTKKYLSRDIPKFRLFHSLGGLRSVSARSPQPAARRQRGPGGRTLRHQSRGVCGERPFHVTRLK